MTGIVNYDITKNIQYKYSDLHPCTGEVPSALKYCSLQLTVSRNESNNFTQKHTLYPSPQPTVNGTPIHGNILLGKNAHVHQLNSEVI